MICQNETWRGLAPALLRICFSTLWEWGLNHYPHDTNMELIFQVSRSPLWLSLFIWLSDVTCRFKAAAWQLQGEDNQPQNSPLGDGHVPVPHWITHLSIFKGRASYSKSSCFLSHEFNKFLFQSEPPMNWHNSPSGKVAMENHGNSVSSPPFGRILSWHVMAPLWAKKLVGFFDSTRRSRLAASSRDAGVLPLSSCNRNGKYMENPRFQNNVISRCDLPHWQNVNVHGE